MERLTFMEMKEEIIEMLDKVENYKGMNFLHCSVNSLIKIEQKKKLKAVEAQGEQK